MSNSPEFWCRHPDCEGTVTGSFKTMYQRNVHLENVHRKGRNPIQDPIQLFEEIKNLKNKLHNEKWSPRTVHHLNSTYTLLYTNPKRAKTKIMRKELLKEIYDLQDDLEWICHSHYMLYHSGSHRDPGIHFPREINDLDVNQSMYWCFRSDTSDIWLDLVVSPTHMNTTDVRAGFCLVDGELVTLDDGNDGRICFNRLLECIEESCDQLEILEKHKKFVDSEKLLILERGVKKKEESGAIDKLEDNVKAKIADFLRASKKNKRKSKEKKWKKKKSKRKKKKSKKRKKSKKKNKSRIKDI